MKTGAVQVLSGDVFSYMVDVENIGTGTVYSGVVTESYPT
jgi:hypothetical protein